MRNPTTTYDLEKFATAVNTGECDEVLDWLQNVIDQRRKRIAEGRQSTN